MGVPMNFPPISISTAQNLLAVLTYIDNSNISIEALISHLREIVDTQIIMNATLNKNSCPSCGKGSLYVCSQTTALVGMTVKVCSRHCGYSEVDNG